MPRAVPRMVALHRRALAGDHGGRAAVAGRAVGARKSARGRKRDGRCRGARARAARIGDSLDGQRRALGLKRPRAKLGRIGLAIDRPRSRSGRSPRCSSSAGRETGERDPRAPRAPSPGSARPASPSASSDRSDEATVADRWPTNRRRPICSPSERLTLSSSPRRTCDARRAARRHRARRRRWRRRRCRARSGDSAMLVARLSGDQHAARA